MSENQLVPRKAVLPAVFKKAEEETHLAIVTMKKSTQHTTPSRIDLTMMSNSEWMSLTRLLTQLNLSKPSLMRV